ncbi:MAG TPA: hypothetical protein VKK79_04990 [Candidatus Lokiarchaeia archaeon]|nr:hypothetical protein [Candidatus Lokiarchaeia archaeon]
MDTIEYTISVPEKLDKYFRILSDLFEWGYETPDKMYTHLLLDAMFAEIETLRDIANPRQTEEFEDLIEQAKCEVCPPQENEVQEDL